MLLDINSIGDDGLAFDETFRLTGVSENTPDLVEAPEMALKGTVQPGPSLRNPAEGARLDGELSGNLKLRCSRCLEVVESACRTVFHFVLVAETPEISSSDAEDEAAARQFFEIKEGKLPLEEVASEQVYLEMPQKPLCEENCAGLCPTCGINRNRLECACRVEDVDPRLQALQEIRDRMSES